jgi:hypothetical protein
MSKDDCAKDKTKIKTIIILSKATIMTIERGDSLLDSLLGEKTDKFNSDMTLKSISAKTTHISLKGIVSRDLQICFWYH